MVDLNPQGREMADESMVRNLAAQAEAIWPQEAPLFRRYALPDQPDVLDAGCGTGEISCRLAQLLPAAQVLGVDIIDSHLILARSRCGACVGGWAAPKWGPRARWAAPGARAAHCWRIGSRIGASRCGSRGSSAGRARTAPPAFGTVSRVDSFSSRAGSHGASVT